MISGFEDDTHYCIKCHKTISGLDNYVTHRKTQCGKQPAQQPIQPPSQQPPAEPQPGDKPSSSLQADDFFSSLELQSSTKKNAPRESFTGKTTTAAGVLTRSARNKVIADLQTTVHSEPSPPKELEIPSSWNQHQTSESEEYSDDDDYEYEDDCEDEDVPPRSHTGGKWKPASSPYQQWSSHEDLWNPPANHTGGKWKPDVPPSYEIPPPSFTGSKWTPSKIVFKDNATSQTKSKSLDREEHPRHSEPPPPPEHTKGKWKPSFLQEENAPPATHTGGKWKPPSIFTTSSAPPATYTKGKWKPVNQTESSSHATVSEISMLRKSSGTVQYWCRPCNRRLASKRVYERHLKSELHFKRTVNDNDFEDDMFTKPKRKMNKQEKSVVEDGDLRNKSSRRKTFVMCAGCDSRVNNQLMGKHLISHYHYRRSDMTSQATQKMCLEYIHAIVLQSPYQCGPCKFYCNTQETFLEHWKSETHSSIVMNPEESFFLCCACKFEADSFDSMYNHLVSKQHQDIIDVINGSVPVVIKKITPVACTTCGLKFKLNIELRKHCERGNHQLPDTNTFRCNHTTCGDRQFKSLLSVRHHRKVVHHEDFFICSLCCLDFTSKLEARRHRQSVQHRLLIYKRDKKDTKRSCPHCVQTFTNIIEMKIHINESHAELCHRCGLCGKQFAIPQDLTAHLRSKACSFDHMSSANNETGAETNSNMRSCDRCPFKSDSTSELIFHKVLHGEPVMILTQDKGDDKDDSQQLEVRQQQKNIPHYKCPFCEVLFEKTSLRCHLRIHTNERPYTCFVCKAGFVRKNNLAVHMKKHQEREAGANETETCEVVEKESLPNRTSKGSGAGEDRPFLCATCGANFKTRFTLQQHLTQHTGKRFNCKRQDCFFRGRSLSELKSHQLTHSNTRPFRCTLCDYRGNTKQQLNRHKTIHKGEKKYACQYCSFRSRLSTHLARHERLHTGSKPYKCPYCDYSCTMHENLRKHILKTSRHPGKCFYECTMCVGTKQFESNSAKDFKVHLMTAHRDQFSVGKDASKFITSMNRGPEEIFVEIVDSTESNTVPKNLNSKNSQGILLASVHQQDALDTNKIPELFPMFNSSKEEPPSELWSTYDVEENGCLVPFNPSIREPLFDEHF